VQTISRKGAKPRSQETRSKVGLFLTLWVFYPITTELTAWYATDFTIALVICAALVVYGFYTSLAGQPLFGGKLLED
jgi:hypothetical protein